MTVGGVIGIGVQIVVEVVGAPSVGGGFGWVVVTLGTVVAGAVVAVGGAVVAGAVGGVVGAEVARGEVGVVDFARVVGVVSIVVVLWSAVVVGKPKMLLGVPSVDEVAGAVAGALGADLGQPAMATPTAALQSTTMAMR